jgi:ABC-type amino acid transport substrate-binding protein
MVHSDNLKNFQTLEDFTKPEVTIVVTTGTFDEMVTSKFLPNATQKSMPGISKAQLVTEVLSSRVDACILETPDNTKLYKDQYGDEIKSIPDITEAVETENAGWALPKGDAEFQKYVSDFLAEQIKNGTMDSLIQTWVKPEYILHYNLKLQ